MVRKSHKIRKNSGHGAVVWSSVAACTMLLAACGSKTTSSAQKVKFVSAPFTGPTNKLKPFIESNVAGPRPPVNHTLAGWVSQSNASFWLEYAQDMGKALSKNHVKLLTADAEGSSSQNINDLTDFLERGVGALETVPVGGGVAQGNTHLELMRKGGFVSGFLSGPADMILSADQYNVGYVQGAAAARYIVKHMKGKADVLLLNNDVVSPVLVPRNTGTIAGLKTGGSGIKIAEDLSLVPSETQGYTLGSTAVEAHPHINVILGDDISALGAMDAIQRSHPGQLEYVSGINGSPQPLALVAKGNTPYKADIAFNYGLGGYLAGVMTVRWFEGLNVPMVAYVKPIVLDSAKAIKEFNQATSHPTMALVKQYMQLIGSISYGSDGHYADYAPGSKAYTG